MDNKTSLHILLTDLEGYKLLSQEEERELLKEAILNKNKEARDTLVCSNVKLIFPIASKYKGCGIEFEDLVSYGIIGLIEAIDNFDLETTYRFNTYASWKILQKISRAVANEGKIIRLPAYVIEKINKINRDEKELTVELGRIPTIEELSIKTDIEVEKLKKYKNYLINIESLDTPIDNSADDGDTIGSMIEDTKAVNPLTMCLNKTQNYEIEAVLNTLTEREANILRYHYGINGLQEKSFDELSQMYGITKDRVRQIENKALRKLRAPSRAKKLKAVI